MLREARFRGYGTQWNGHLGVGGEGRGRGEERGTQYSAPGDGALRLWYTEDRSPGVGVVGGGGGGGEERRGGLNTVLWETGL